MRAYFGHHKCGSTWIWELVHGVCRDIGLPHYLVLAERNGSGRGALRAHASASCEGEHGFAPFTRDKLRERTDAAGAAFVSCINADCQQREALKPDRAFHVIRDPRDVIVSGYFSHRDSHPTNGLPHLAKHRSRLNAVSKEDGLLLEMDFARTDLLELGRWDYARPEILELRLEDLVARPYDGFIRIFQHLELLRDDEPTRMRELLRLWLGRTLNRLSERRMLGRLRQPMPAAGETLLGAVYANRFETKTRGRSAGTEDSHSHYRKGVAGDWINHFTPAHADAFKERFDGLLEKLGYETNDRWAAVQTFGDPASVSNSL